MKATSLDRIDAHLDRLAERIAGGDLERRSASISGWSVAQQLDHTLKVAAAFAERLNEAGQEPRTPINWTGRVLLTLGWLPRGVGKAPAATTGVDHGADELQAALARLRGLLATLRARPDRLADKRRVARHPIFGGLTTAQSLRFVEIHTHHHLKIIRDIDRAA